MHAESFGMETQFQSMKLAAWKSFGMEKPFQCLAGIVG